MLFLTSSLAQAATCATPLTEQGMRDIVQRAKEAIDAGDIAAHTMASDELAERVPCLDQQLPTRPWADYLVTASLVKNLNKDPGWNQPMSVALALVPEHPDVPSFLMLDYKPPAESALPPTPLPTGVVFILDGRVILDEVPALSGLHVVQTVQDGQWNSRLLRDEPLPAEFVPDRPPPPPPPPDPTPSNPFAWGVVGVTGGFGGWRQETYSDRVEPRDTAGATFGISTQGQQPVGAQSLGLFWSADVTLQLAESPEDDVRPVPFGQAFAGVAVLSPVAVWAGAGLTTVRVQERKSSGFDERPLLVPHYLLGLSFHTSGTSLPLDASVGGGFGPALGGRDPGQPSGGWGSHAMFRGGIAPIAAGSVHLRIGADATWARASLGDQDDSLSDRTPLATAHTWRAGVNIGLRWGG